MNPTAMRRYGAVTPAQANALDAAALQLGIDIRLLMEVAGFQVARLGWRMLSARADRVHVVAGHGNNGGDALVAARHLAGWGCSVTAAVVGDPDHLRSLMREQMDAAHGSGVVVISAAHARAADPPGGAVLIVDGLLGTGLRQRPRPLHAAVIANMRGRVLSIDVPSGLDAADGRALGPAVEATVTCALTACKSGFWSAHAARWTGQVHVADIGMPAEAWRRCGLLAPTAVRGGSIRRVPTAPAARRP